MSLRRIMGPPARLSNGTGLRFRTACIAPMRPRRYIAGIPIQAIRAGRPPIRWRPTRQIEAGTMKQGIHPDYHEITVVMTDGTSYQTRSTYGKAGDTLRLEIDPKSHPAWTGGQQRLLDTGGQLARFNRRFQGFGVKTS